MLMAYGKMWSQKYTSDKFGLSYPVMREVLEGINEYLDWKTE